MKRRMICRRNRVALAGGNTLDVYGKYFMNRRNSASFDMGGQYELDGKATGTADGFAIRGTDPSSASVRAELGATMQPDDKSPWKLDLNLAGFAGKKQGLTGGVSVSLMF